MSKILKYLIYALVAIFAFSWFKIVLDARQSNAEGISTEVDGIKDKAGRVVGDLMGSDEDEEEDNDIGDGEDDLDADELDEDEILTEDWDEEDETEEDEEETIASVATKTKKGVDKYGGAAAADKLASKGSSKSANKATTNAEKVVTTSSNGRFLVIGGSFSSKGNANTFVKQLEKLGYEDAEIVVFDKAKKYHTVSVARFDSKTDAKKVVGALKGKGIPDAYVHKKRG